MRALHLLPAAMLCALVTGPAVALDPPHDASQSIECSTCHTPHTAPGGALTSVAGNANLCLSCHRTGGPATALPFVDGDQALPGPGLPPARTATGSSHRWDSGPSGHTEADVINISSGSVRSGGAFTGRFAKTYTLTITTPGDVGVAAFSWVATSPPGGSGSGTTGVDVVLDEGITVTFTDEAPASCGFSFCAGDRWFVYVRTDLVQPSDAEMAVRLENGKLMCSTCHDQHSQEMQPFDATAPVYGGDGTGEGRHFQRVANDAGQMCVDCHSPRDVATAAGGSHPVGVAIPGGDYQAPSLLPLDTNSDVACMTCHTPHYAPTTDGSLTRLADQVALCSDCHTLAAANASHLDSGTGVLWPGGQYSSNFPAVTDSGKTGACSNCHQPHGWPDGGAPAQDYPTLLVETPTDLCVTCHDGAPASNQLVDFSSTIWVSAGAGAGLLDNEDLNNHHDVLTSDQSESGTDLACSDCHDPHSATVLRPDPDTGDGRVPASGSEWCLDCHDDSLPAGVTPPTTALTDVRDSWLNNDKHGTTDGNATLKDGYGWADNDIVPCTACHVEKHGSTNLFQLRTTVLSKDGSTEIPSDPTSAQVDCGGAIVVEVTDNSVANQVVNGWCFCNTCHTDSMGKNQDNCFESGCHAHGAKM